MDVLSENDYTARQIMDALAEEFRTPTMREFAHILTGMVVEGEIECDMDGKVMRYSLKIDKDTPAGSACTLSSETLFPAEGSE